jgi:hypothetical protein
MKLIETIHKNLLEKPQEKRLYIGASTIGRPCARAIWYGYKGVEKEFDARTLLTFEVGKALERVIKCFALKPLWEEFWDEVDVKVNCKEVPELQGTLDAIVNEEIVLEIKSAKDASFSVFRRDGLRKWSTNYFYQIQAYMGMAGLLKGVLLAINKDTSELHEEWVDFEPKVYEDIKRKAQAIVDCNEPPMRINNNPAFYVCNRCEFKGVCHGN